MEMKYEKPTAEKVEFRYRDQVVAASGNNNGPSVFMGSGKNCTHVPPGQANK